MIISADLHLDKDSADVVLGEVLPGLREAALNSPHQVIALLGDIWHLRYRVDVALLNAVREELLEGTRAGISYEIIPGNHDQVDVAGRNALEVLGDLSDVSVHNHTSADYDNRTGLGCESLWVPYRKRHADLVAALDYTDIPLAFMHHGIRGAWMNDQMQDTEGLDPEALGTFARVFLGHYHRHHILTNKAGTEIIYVGSPRQVTAAESGQDKGFLILHPNSTVTFERRAWGSRFHRLVSDADGVVDLSAVRPGDDVRVAAPNGVNTEALARRLDEVGAKHVVTVERPEVQARLVTKGGDDLSLRAFAEAYAQSHGGVLDVGRLMREFDDLGGAS